MQRRLSAAVRRRQGFDDGNRRVEVCATQRPKKRDQSCPSTERWPPCWPRSANRQISPAQALAMMPDPTTDRRQQHGPTASAGPVDGRSGSARAVILGPPDFTDFVSERELLETRDRERREELNAPLGIRNALANALTFSKSVPTTAAGSGWPMRSHGLPGHMGHHFAGRVIADRETKSSGGAPGMRELHPRPYYGSSVGSPCVKQRPPPEDDRPFRVTTRAESSEPPSSAVV